MNEIAQNFKKLKEWLGENYPEGLEALNLPATNKEITKLKDTLGFDIPQELEELLRCHNGQPFEKIGVFDELLFLDSEQIAIAYAQNQGLIDEDVVCDDKVQTKNWTQNLLPFTFDQYGEFGFIHAIDINPTASGQFGQVVLVDMYAEIKLKVIASSLSEFLAIYVNYLYNNEEFKQQYELYFNIQNDNIVIDTNKDNRCETDEDQQLYQQIELLNKKQQGSSNISDWLAVFQQAKELMKDKSIEQYRSTYQFVYSQMVMQTYKFLKEHNETKTGKKILEEFVLFLNQHKSYLYLDPVAIIYKIHYAAAYNYWFDDERLFVKYAEIFVENCTYSKNVFFTNDKDALDYFIRLKFICNELIKHYKQTAQNQMIKNISKKFITVYDIQKKHFNIDNEELAQFYKMLSSNI